MVAQERQTLGVELVDAARAFAAVAHQAGFLEDAEMLGNGRARNRETCGQFVDGPGRSAEHFKDGQAGRVAEGGESAFYVSIHLP